MDLHALKDKHLLHRTGISYLLFPFSLVYYLGHRIKQCIDVLNRYRAPQKVISVGNLTAGGSGKTPLTIDLVTHLESWGIRTAISHRAYRSLLESRGAIVIGKEASSPEPHLIGDEAALYASRLPAIPLLLGRKRAATLKLLQSSHPEVQVVVMDDSLQNKTVYHDLDIVVISTEMGLGNGFLLPAGYLREPVSSLKPEQFVVFISKSGTPVNSQLLNQVQKQTNHIYMGSLIPDQIRNIKGEIVHNDLLGMSSIVLCSGIGNPDSFDQMVASCGLSYRTHIAYPDHYDFLDISLLRNAIFRNKADYVLCTEKDLLKLAKYEEIRNILLYLPLKLRWKDQQFWQDLKGLLGYSFPG